MSTAKSILWSPEVGRKKTPARLYPSQQDFIGGAKSAHPDRGPKSPYPIKPMNHLLTEKRPSKRNTLQSWLIRAVNLAAGKSRHQYLELPG